MEKSIDLEGIVVATISRTHEEFSQMISEHVGQYDDIGTVMDPRMFSGGEYGPKFRFGDKNQMNLINKSVYIISTQGPFQNPQDIGMRICLAAGTAKENGAKGVYLVATDLSYSRQDRGPSEDKKMVGEGNTAKLYAELLANSGVDGVITLHSHNRKIKGYYEEAMGASGEKVFFDVWPYSLLSHYLLTKSSLDIENNGENIVVVSPDKGARKFSEKLRDSLYLNNAGMLYLSKARNSPNKPDEVIVDNPRLENTDTLDKKTIIFPDDIIDTGGTIIKTVDWLNNSHKNHGFGNPKDYFFYFTHAVMSGRAYEGIQNKLAKLNAKEFIVTNTRPFISDNRSFRFKKNSTVLRTAKLFGDMILRHYSGEDLEGAYDFKSKTQLIKTMKRLYVIKRSSHHFMDKRR
tara:strand:+ start:403 stop:1614 length:1212 start_codon:yes stop_codon:yes gene_type:complete